MQRRTTKTLIVGIAGISTILTGVLLHNNNNFVQAKSAARKANLRIQLQPTSRTAAQMIADNARAVSTNQKVQVPPFRTNIPNYKALKNALVQSASPSAVRRSSSLSSSPKPLATIGVSCEGNSATEGLRPPDTHGAIGKTQFVEVTNSRIGIFNKDCSTARSVTLASFFGYFTQTLFDPRAVYDSTWNRWIVTAEAFEENAQTQYHYIAVSKTENATGDYYIYRINVKAFNANAFWDYPQLGFDQNSVIITANIFPNSGGAFGQMLSIAKARLYNGEGFSVPVFTNLQFSLAPPIVLDQSASTFLTSARASGNTIQLYKLTNSSNAFEATLTGPVNVSVPSYTLPPDAEQPGTPARLDTLDARFVNASTQVGNSLWQVHTINFAGYPTPRYYEINTSTNSLNKNGIFIASGTSNDWNASIAANRANDRVFVTWNSTDPTRGINAQVRGASSSVTSDPNSVSFGAGVSLFQSSTFYNATGGNGAQRWGDYSAVTIDPLDSARAWLVNQKNNSTTIWGSRFGSISHP